MRRWYGLLLLVFLLVGVFLACGESSPSGGSSPAGNSPTTTQPAGHLKVGQSAKVGDWQITVNSVKTDPGSDFNKPQKAGNVFLLVDVTMKNTSGQQQVATSLGQFKLRNAAGEEMAVTIVTGVEPAPNGNVAAGAQVKGKLAFEVPKGAQTYSLEVTAGIGSSDQMIWDIKV